MRRQLKEPDSPYWTRELLVDLFNEQKDLREMQLHEAHEGFSKRVYTTNLVAGQAFYELPDGQGRLKRVSKLYTAQQRWKPLIRAERWFSPSSTNTDASEYADFSFRVIGNFIVLEPTPGTAETDALRIEIEEATARLESDNQSLPPDWPLFTETLLVLDTVIAAYGVEEAQDEEVKIPPWVTRRRTRFEGQWDAYINTRTFSPSFATRYHIGG